MTLIKGHGKPNRDTSGAVGVLYKDLKTGDIYKCVSAYRANSFSDYTHEWKLLTEEEISEIVVEKESPVNMKPEPAVDKKPQTTPKRTDYTNYAKK